MEPEMIPVRNGRLTCRVQGSLVRLCLEVRPERPGLYRGLLRGSGGTWDLGLLLPEGGCLRVGRTLSLQALEEAGCWPVQSAEAVLAHPFSSDDPPPQGWKRTRKAADLLAGDPLLARTAAETPVWLVRPGADGAFSLAAPWDSSRPFPLAPAFCLARVEESAGRRLVVYRFSPDGRPVLPEREK